MKRLNKTPSLQFCCVVKYQLYLLLPLCPYGKKTFSAIYLTVKSTARRWPSSSWRDPPCAPFHGSLDNFLMLTTGRRGRKKWSIAHWTRDKSAGNRHICGAMFCLCAIKSASILKLYNRAAIPSALNCKLRHRAGRSFSEMVTAKTEGDAHFL